MASEDNTYSEETIYEKQLEAWKAAPEDTPSEASESDKEEEKESVESEKEV